MTICTRLNNTTQTQKHQINIIHKRKLKIQSTMFTWPSGMVMSVNKATMHFSTQLYCGAACQITWKYNVTGCDPVSLNSLVYGFDFLCIFLPLIAISLIISPPTMTLQRKWEFPVVYLWVCGLSIITEINGV